MVEKSRLLLALHISSREANSYNVYDALYLIVITYN
jgi:hypothetical protein